MLPRTHYFHSLGVVGHWLGLSSRGFCWLLGGFDFDLGLCAVVAVAIKSISILQTRMARTHLVMRLRDWSFVPGWRWHSFKHVGIFVICSPLVSSLIYTAGCWSVGNTVLNRHWIAMCNWQTIIQATIEQLNKRLSCMYIANNMDRERREGDSTKSRY